MRSMAEFGHHTLFISVYAKGFWLGLRLGFVLGLGLGLTLPKTSTLTINRNPQNSLFEEASW